MDKMMARQMVETLSKGINPLIGTCLPDTDVCANEQMQEALDIVLEACNIPTVEEQRKLHSQIEKWQKQDTYPRAGRPWTAKEEKELVRLSKINTITDISKKLKRTPGAIRSKMENLGLLSKSANPYYRKHK